MCLLDSVFVEIRTHCVWEYDPTHHITQKNMKKSTLWRTLAQYVSPSWFLSHTANKTVSLPSILQILHRQPNLRKLRKIMMIKNPCQRLRNQNWIPMIYFLNTFIAQRWRSKVVGKFAVGIGVPLSSNSKLDDVHVEKMRIIPGTYWVH